MSERCVFLDRDGVINVKIEGDYVRSWEEFQFLPGIVDWIRLFNTLGYLVIVVTNQRGVSLGRMSLEDVASVHQRMTLELAAQGAHLDDVFVCPHPSDSCECRKPKPGMVFAAQAKWGIDLKESLMIGDSDSDAEMAANAGLRFLRAEGGRLV